MTKPKTAATLKKEIAAADEQTQKIESQAASLASKTVKPTDDLYAEELALARLQEKTRLERQALTNTVARLAEQRAVLEQQLKAAEAREYRAECESKTAEAIAAVEALRPKLESAVASVLQVMDELKAVETEYGPHVRGNLDCIRKGDPSAARKVVRDSLLNIKALVYLPKLTRVNGRGGSPLRYYGDVFKVEADFVDMEKR